MTTRASDGPADMEMEMEPEDLMLHKHPSMTMLNDKELLRQTGRRTIQNFLKSYKCYDLLRQSGKVVVFDTNIPFQLAFYALVEHDIKAAPLWDASGRRFVGVMVITDFIDTVRDYYGQGVTMTDVAAKSIAQVVRDPEGHRMFHSEFWHGTADDTVYHACELIVKKKLRFLPIMNPEENLMLSVLSQFDILDYLVSTFREQRKLFEQSIFELNIGVFGTIITMSHTSRLYEVLEVMEKWNISAIPIVDDDSRVIDLYHRFDVTFIAVAGDVESTMSNLNMIVGDLLEQRKGVDPAMASLHTCSQHDSLQTIFERFSQVKFQTLVCVDAERRCTGVVAIGDLVAYFID